MDNVIVTSFPPSSEASDSFPTNGGGLVPAASLLRTPDPSWQAPFDARQ